LRHARCSLTILIEWADKSMMAEAVRSNPKKTFLSGVLLLSMSTVLVKVLGLIYKIPMLTYLGSEGMGYFNSAYEIYALFCVIASAGLPVALSVLISSSVARGEEERVPAIYRASMTIFVWIGILGTAIMLFLAGFFCRLIKSEHAYYCILSIAPTVFFVCISSGVRGYFQGYQKMLPTAVSQLLESVGKLVFGLLLARFALHRGYTTSVVAAFAGLGLTLGSAFSMLYLLLEKRRFSQRNPWHSARKNTENTEKSSKIWKRLARLAIPMTLGASLVSMTKLIDMTMILRRLQSIGYTEIAANEAYGSYTTLALSVYGLLPALINAVALPLVPMLSSSIASGDRHRQAEMIRMSYRITATLAIPTALGISAFARPILSILFGSDPQAVSFAAPLLSYLGVSVFLSCMITATNSVLHAYQEVHRPIRSMLFGAAVKVAGAYLLIGIPQIGLVGAPISTFFCNAIVVLLNLGFVSALCPIGKLKALFLKPLLAAALSVGLSMWVYWLVERHAWAGGAIALAFLVAVSAYLLLACFLGVICREDVRLLPMGDRLCHALQRTGILRKTEDKK